MPGRITNMVRAVSTNGWASALLAQEARALLTRLAKVRPFSLLETMVSAAAIPRDAQIAIDRYLLVGRREVHRLVREFLRWLESPQGRGAMPAEAQRRFTMLRLRFNTSLAQFDIFADALTQRSESQTGIWLAGLDMLAADALSLPGGYYTPPSLICYLDRGHGAAIRRARTRLPGGGENPVAIIRVPRERMVGSGIASSLVHEVGHQAAALLDLAESIRPILRGLQRNSGNEAIAWQYWDRCISEILADFWSVARIGITSTIGLMGVVALPRYFVFRLSLDDPHPVPWLRVKLSCAMGRALYPHPQWDRLESIWESFYPPVDLDREKRETLMLLEKTMPGLATLIAHHRPKALRGASLKEALEVDDRRPARLTSYFYAWRRAPSLMRRAPPSLVFAVIGQARAEGKISPEEESGILTGMLSYWTLRDTLDPVASGATSQQARGSAPFHSTTVTSRRQHG